VTLAMLFAPATVAAGARAQVATCEQGPVMVGSGSPNWRRSSFDAGPLGVRANPLSQMSKTRNGQLVTKMPALVERGAAVVLRVPPRLRHRVFLYYGAMRDGAGRRTTRIAGSPGFSEVEFRPCSTKPRTIWPGGIRVKGRKPVWLAVQVEGSPDTIPLSLGRPKPYSPA